jgi:hypothetical protein
MNALDFQYVLAAGDVRQPTKLVKRAPLPPIPGGAFSEGDFSRDLWFEPPKKPDLFWWRGNFCGLHMPNAPWVPGCEAKNQACVMACLLDRYPRTFQDEYLDTYASYGYTHLQRSVGHAVGAGVSVRDYLDLSRRARDRGLFLDHWFVAGPDCWGNDCKYRDLDFWAPRLDPWIDALISAQVVDAVCVGWQLDGMFKAGDQCKAAIFHVADQFVPHKIPVATHWMNDAGGWWEDDGKQDRFSWWREMRGHLSGVHLQLSTPAAGGTMANYQEAIRLVVDPFAGDTGRGVTGRSGLFGDRPYFCTMFEISGQDQFDGVTTEDLGDLVGYLTMCTRSKMPVSGYGNGARRPDGSPL